MMANLAPASSSSSPASPSSSSPSSNTSSQSCHEDSSSQDRNPSNSVGDGCSTTTISPSTETATINTPTISDQVDESKMIIADRIDTDQVDVNTDDVNFTPSFPSCDDDGQKENSNEDVNGSDINDTQMSTLDNNNMSSSSPMSTTSQQQSSNNPSSSASSNNNSSSSSSSTIEDMETVERLEKYSSSEIIFHRQVASRSILETFHEVRGNPNDLKRVADVVSRFSNDSEPSIRAELAEQLPQIACFCLNPANGIPSSMSNITLPIIEQFLSDSNSQVRKITQNSLCFMLEQSIIDLIFIEDKIAPILVHLMDSSNLDDFRIEAVTTVSKIARFVGKDVTERRFLSHYSRLCTDISFHVRRVCAANIGEMSTVVGQSLTESVLLPQFKSLCEDGIWGVRKACADVFVPVSCVCSNQVRRDVLGPLFVGLLCDQSKWVKTAAFQALGPFISTFADPRKTGLYYNDGGVIVVGGKVDESVLAVNGTDTRCDSVEESGEKVVENEPDVQTITIEDMALSGGDKDSMQVDVVDGPCLVSDSNGNSSSESMEVDKKSDVPVVNGYCDPSSKDESSPYNAFQYWRVPIPDLKPVVNTFGPNKEPIVHWELDEFKVDEDEPPTDLSSNVNPLSNCDRNYIEFNSTSQMYNGNDSSLDPLSDLTVKFLSPSDVMKTGPMQQIKRMIPDQDTIPAELLEHYLNMTSPANFDSIDNDLTHHCAFSLPAVAMTLGRKHWPCLRDTFESLTVDMQWKVRWTLASSLHQMAQILGPEYTSRDLLPAFLAFMKDLDEVRYGVLQNLSSILKILNRPEQLAILPKISDFMKMDNPRNWRFRATLGQQINAIITLYHPSDIKEYLLPVAFALLRDKVSEVRIGSIKLLSTIMRHFYCDGAVTLTSLTPLPEPEKAESVRVNLECLLISELTSLVDSSKWIYRQVFVFLVEQMITDRSLPNHIFADHFIPPLLTLAADRVPNIRMALSRCLVRSIYGNSEMFEDQQEQVLNVLHKFAQDTDSDVKRFANMIRSEDKKVNGCPEEESMNVDQERNGNEENGQKDGRISRNS